MGRAEGRRQVGIDGAIRSSGLTFAVTGATGWLGRAAAEVVARALGEDAVDGRLHLYASRSRELRLDSGIALPVKPLAALGGTQVDVLLHFAFVTREFAADYGTPEYVMANLGITARVLGALRARPPAFVGYASSGAATGALRAGRLDVSADPYGTLKVMDELMLRTACADVGARSLVVRVFNIAGPWLEKTGAFAISDLIRQVADGGPVRIRARRPVVRSYVDVEDVVSLMLATALDASVPDGITVETAGEIEVEMRALAEHVKQALGRPDVAIERDVDAAAAADRYVGDGRSFAALAARTGVPLRPLDAQIARTAQGMGIPVANAT